MNDYLTGAEAGQRLGITPSAVASLRKRGQLRHFTQAGDERTSPFLYSASEIEMLRARRLAEAEKGGDVGRTVTPPAEGAGPEATAVSAIGRTFLIALGQLGGTVADESGRATSQLVARMQGYSAGSVSSSCKTLEVLGLIERDVSGKRTSRIALTAAGRAWLDANDDEPPPPPKAAVAVPAVAPPPAPPEPAPARQAAVQPPLPVDPPVTSNGHTPAAVNPDELARAMLRQATRILSDTDVATLSAERDALRAHNASLVDRLGQVTADRDAAERELREVKGVLHGIEAQLMPMLVGNDASLGWLDAGTRTDLLRLVGEAASWATH
jgi:DNA-binding MarR family transcriptional regulator